MPRYDWSRVQTYYDAGHSRQECIEYFGFDARTWSNARKRGLITVQKYRLKLIEYLRIARSRTWVKRRLIEEGILRDCCYECGITHWYGEKLSLHLDHINGQHLDHRIENLRMLCPNCHSQTDTFGWRNAFKRGENGEAT